MTLHTFICRDPRSSPREGSIAALLLTTLLIACGPSVSDLSATNDGAIEPEAPIGETEAAVFTWALEKNTLDAFELFLTRFPDGQFADLAIGLRTEAAIRGNQAAPVSIDNAFQTLSSVGAAPATLRESGAPAVE